MKQTYRILVVDDEEIVRKVLRRILTGAGYYVEESGNGIAALAHLADRKFEAVTVDLKMPGMSGLELLDEIKRLYPDVAVIISTAVNDLTTAVDCMKRGAKDYLVKPFTPDDVKVVMSRALEKREGEVQVKDYHYAVENELKTILKNRQVEKKEFLHNVAHQIRTPLTAVIASSEVLLDSIESRDVQQVRTLTGCIKRSAWALNKNLAQMLNQEEKN